MDLEKAGRNVAEEGLTHAGVANSTCLHSRIQCYAVPGWDLITPVGAPLEDVVGSAETSDEGGTHLKMEHSCRTRTLYIRPVTSP